MRDNIKVLLVEDSEHDAQLVLRELKRAGLKFESRRVDSEAALRASLREFRPQIVVSDFSMPGFNGVAALAICRELDGDVPFIFMSGTVGEDVAVEAMKAGASDYVMKSNFARLGPAVKRELREAAIRAERGVGVVALRQAQAMAMLAHVITGPDGAFESWSETLPQLIGVESARMPSSTREWLALVHPEDRALFRGTAIEAGRRGVRMNIEYRLRRADGAWVHILQVLEPLPGTGGPDGRTRWFATIQDVSAQKLAANELRASEERFRTMFEQAAVGVVHTSFDGDVTMANPNFCEMTGFAHVEAIQLNIRDLTHPEDLERSVEGRSRMLSASDKPYQRDLRLLRKDRSELWANITTSLVRGGDGKPLHFLSVVNDISERKRAERHLRRFQFAMDMSVDSIYLTDAENLRFVYVNDVACRRLGYSRDRLLQMGPEGVLGKTRDEISREYGEVIKAGDQGVRFEGRFQRSDGSEGWTEIHRRALVADGRQLVVTIGRDITERKLADERIRRLNRIYAVLSGINSAIVRIRDRGELFQEACRIAVDAGKFKFTWICVVDRDELLLKPIAVAGDDNGFLETARSRLSLRDDAPDGHGPAAAAIREKSVVVINDVMNDPRILYKSEHAERGVRSVAILPVLLNGEAVAAFGLHSGEVDFFDEDEMKLLVELAGDIAFALDHIEKAGRLDYLAYYDQLTGLANRTLFQERLIQHIHTAETSGSKVAVVVADIERFRMVNDSLGRRAGDALLKQVAGRLAQAVDQTGIARLGADHFAIVLPEMKGRSEIGRTLESIWHQCADQPFVLDGTEIRIALKIGIALFPGDGKSADTLFRNAEAAWKNAKRKDERYLYHSAEMTARVAEKLTLENKLREAIEKEEFVLHYQPKVDLETRGIVGMEALIRWQSPERGLVPPGHFIPMLEETGLILKVGAWALRRAVLDHGDWLKKGLRAPRIAVNVSQIQMRQRDFVDVVKETIAPGADPTGIDLEITESLLMEDVAGNIKKLKAVCDLGLKIAIDDFGTGYSSLGYLAQLPVHTLKIDRSFIMKMLSDPNAMTLVQTIITLAHSLRMSVVAEGVEQEDQAKMLRLLRCDEMQGYLISKPVPIEEITSLLRQ